MPVLRERICMVSFPVQASWIGKVSSSEHARSQNMRNKMIQAQWKVLDRLQETATTLRMYWLIKVGEGLWEWNAQYPIPDGATELVCVGIAQEVVEEPVGVGQEEKR